jgi:hypothetical protein
LKNGSSKSKHCLDSISDRLEKNEAFAKTMNQLSTDIQLLAAQIKTQNDKLQEIVMRYDAKFKDQGERMGKLETKPAHRWEAAVGQIISLVIAAIVAFAVAKIF